MNNRVNIFCLLLFSVVFIISGCSSDTKTSESETDELVRRLVTYNSEDSYTAWNDEDVTYINLNETSTTADGNDGVIVDDNQIAIRTTGTYVVEGTLEDGQILVDAEDDGTVRIVLNGASIHSSTSAPIYVKQANKMVISLEKNTENVVSDATEYVFEEEETDEPEAAIFSKDDLTINGSGTLTVNGNYNDGITSRDDLKIAGGIIEVTSVDDGIVGRDLLAMKGATVSVTATGDGVKASNDEDESKGNIVLESGTLKVKAEGDGVQAEKTVAAAGGKYSIVSGGGSPETIESTDELGRTGKGQFNPGDTEEGTEGMPQMPNGDEPSAGTEGMPQMPNDEPPEETEDMPQIPNGNEPPEETESEDTISTKGIKAGTELIIAGGTFSIDSLDDGLHSDQNLTISGGKINISTGDDAIHGDEDLAINGGTIAIKKSLEGIEGVNVTIADGTIHINAEDDGVNVNSGSSDFGKPGMNGTKAPNANKTTEETADQGKLLIEGGYLYVNANGDGLDSNTSIKMTDGTVIVYGPTSSGNGALDYDQSFHIEGGILVAAGSSGMAQGISDTSPQHAVMMTFAEMQKAGTTVYMEDRNGKQVFAIAPEKSYQTIIISTPDLANEQTYTLNSGGVLTGKNKDGLYEAAEYEDDSPSVEFTLSDMMTYLDESGVTEAPSNSMFGGRGHNGMEGVERFNTDQKKKTEEDKVINNYIK
ncbi:carbohydrate-binding domain-containing protein [Virgibacillus ndiopensis]|uniref:carbohydrate-binding domain-containing protein n=1 Tax=Virgibacillus ndiopensis TaxID=2004408 RepID=UPI000C067F13|nr:carbohydrate-binding domain-containing protein [Virgibacillus ndiopensis]